MMSNEDMTFEEYQHRFFQRVLDTNDPNVPLDHAPVGKFKLGGHYLRMLGELVDLIEREYGERPDYAIAKNGSGRGMINLSATLLEKIKADQNQNVPNNENN